MSVAAIVAAARGALKQTMLSSTCTKTSGGTTFACFYEETQPPTGGSLDYETGDSYGHTLYYRDADATLKEGQAVTVDGITLEIQRVRPIGLHDPIRRAEATKR